MPLESISLRYRLTRSYRDRLLAYADSERWSIALATQDIVEEFLDKRDAIPEPVEPTPHPAAVLPPAPVVLLGVERDPDRLLAVLRQALIDKGFDKIGSDGIAKRVVQHADLRKSFYDSRPRHTAHANKAGLNRA